MLNLLPSLVFKTYFFLGELFKNEWNIIIFRELVGREVVSGSWVGIETKHVEARVDMWRWLSRQPRLDIQIQNETRDTSKCHAGIWKINSENERHCGVGKELDASS